MSDTCRRSTCDKPRQDESGYSGRFCSDKCEVKHDHLKADAEDQPISNYGKYNE